MTSHPGFRIAVSCAAFLVAVSAPAFAGTPCTERITFDEAYECSFRGQSDGPAADGTLVFAALEGADGVFTATLDLEGVTSVGYCTCKTRMSSSPAFGGSKDFECVTDFADGAVESMEGTVSGSGRKVEKGQVWSVNAPADFLRLVFSCRLDRSGGGDDGDGDSDGNGDGSGEPLGVRFQPASWNTKWLEKGKGSVSAQVRGEGFDEIDPETVVLVGTDPAAAPLAPVSVDWQGNQLRARFARGDAIATLDDPQPGETHTVALQFELAGAPTELFFDVVVSGD